jgi:hypothetical protein
MKREIHRHSPELRLERVVENLSEELAFASDDELREAAAELRASLEMKGSLPFVGIKHLFLPYVPEKFGNPELEMSGRRAAEPEARRTSSPDKPTSPLAKK